MTNKIANLLSIAGSDPSGGAGVQADLKSFAARGCYGMAAITALTAQNTQGVFAALALEAEFVSEQIRRIFSDIRVDAVKIGMIANAQIARAVADALRPFQHLPIVLDPVMVAKGGSSLLDYKAVAIMKDVLFPLATLLTPNLPEAAVLLDEAEAQDQETMQGQAQRLAALGPKAVLLKGGHLAGPQSSDVLYHDGRVEWLLANRVNSRNTHGTGCALSSAIAAELAKGRSLSEASHLAKSWLDGAIRAADQLSVGEGHGPVNHFHAMWRI